MFYPYIDLDNTDQQDLTNDVTLPRYTDGKGVRMLMMMQTPGTSTATNITINYTNQDGVAKTITTAYRASGAIGVIGPNMISTSGGSAGPFFPLADGDRGVRSVQSVQLAAGVGGFGVMLLAKPLFTMSANELSSTVEKNFLREHAAHFGRRVSQLHLQHIHPDKRLVADGGAGAIHLDTVRNHHAIQFNGRSRQRDHKRQVQPRRLEQDHGRFSLHGGTVV
jgi:hypothetical protein